MATDLDPCAASEHRQFDFWLGDWNVHRPDGTLAGRNRIVSLFDGCVLHESWEGSSGHRGTSLNIYDAARGVWHQTWVDSSGMLLVLEGGLQADAMVLEGRSGSPTEPTVTVRHRISWTLIDGDPDRLRQHWEFSADGGSWETLFDGRYARRGD
jgi:Protein of unknown function (DUF1579)